jgi:hypothetical protein
MESRCASNAENREFDPLRVYQFGKDSVRVVYCAVVQTGEMVKHFRGFESHLSFLNPAVAEMD